jgi:hypothetical protein
MASDSIEVEVFKNERLVATARSNVRIVEPVLQGLPRTTAFNIPLLDLERMVVFDHLAGAPLSRFLDRAGLRVHHLHPETDEELDSDMIEPVFYVHGRSETARGSMTVSAVCLIWFDCPIDGLPRDRDLLPQLPYIYKEVTKIL